MVKVQALKISVPQNIMVGDVQKKRINHHDQRDSDGQCSHIQTF